MTLVLRRARAALPLLLAAGAASGIAVLLLTALAGYSREVVEAGTRSAVQAAPAVERSVLLRGPLGTPQQLAERDSRLHARYADGFGGLDAQVFAAGYATGRQFPRDVGTVTTNPDGVAFASVAFLDALAEHTDLRAGRWPEPGRTPTEATLAEAAAAALRARPGDRIPITDRLTGRTSQITVVGVWRPRDAGDAYWRLAPEAVAAAASQSSTYGPVAVTRQDFLSDFATSASTAWLVAPALTEARPADLPALRRAAQDAVSTLPAALGFDSSAVATSQLDRLVERLRRGDLVGRSALLTPMLLMAVLGAYTLVLVALLLGESRRGEVALLRARGAARSQMAALAAREAALVVLPAAVLAPPLATEMLRRADHIPAVAGGALRLAPQADALTWTVAAVAALSCAVVMLLPGARRADTYLELAGRTRPRRGAAVQRAGVDVLLVALAVLAWLQLRQYSSTVSTGRDAGLSIDPLLTAAPTLGVLAGSVLALRVLPPLTRLAERFVDRRPWLAATLGAWQAGRRPHAGPVLLLALAVAISTLAWCLAGTSERSVVDQADHQVGADLRLVETGSSPAGDRAEQLAQLPGARAVVPAWRESLRLGTNSEAATMVALDARRAPEVVRLRADLATETPASVFRTMTDARPAHATVALPAGARRLTGSLDIRVSARQPEDLVAGPRPVTAQVVLALPDGGHRRLPAGTVQPGGTTRLLVELPSGGGPVGLAGFLFGTSAPDGAVLDWELTDLRVDGRPVGPAELANWHGRDGQGRPATTRPTSGGLAGRYEVRGSGGFAPELAVQIVVTGAPATAPVPVVATGAALSALRMAVGDHSRLTLAGADVPVRVTAMVAAIPGVAEPAALLVDLPSLSTALLGGSGVVRDGAPEWWISTVAGEPATAATAAAALGGFQVLDRRAAAAATRQEPYGRGARTALFAAALGAVLLAAVGLVVDIQATARRRMSELAVLHALGAGPRLLARALVAEHGLLAGLGLLVGALVGVGVAATMAPLVILSPSAGRPVPVPLLAVPWLPVLASAGALLALALALSGVAAATTHRRLAAARLRIGADG